MRNFRKAGYEDYPFPVAVLMGVVWGVFFGFALFILFNAIGGAIFGAKQKANIWFFANIFLPISITVCVIGGVLIAIIRRPKRAPLPPGIEEAIQTRFVLSTQPPNAENATDERIQQPEHSPGPIATEPTP